MPNRAKPSVTRITEVCVDLKLSTSESIGPDDMLVRPKVSLGGFFTEIIGSKLNLGYKDIEDMKKEKAMPKENKAIKLKRDVANCEADLKTANEVFNPYWSIRNAEQRNVNCFGSLPGWRVPEASTSYAPVRIKKAGTISITEM